MSNVKTPTAAKRFALSQLAFLAYGMVRALTVLAAVWAGFWLVIVLAYDVAAGDAVVAARFESSSSFVWVSLLAGLGGGLAGWLASRAIGAMLREIATRLGWAGLRVETRLWPPQQQRPCPSSRGR
jgi:hypothetical protein